MSQPPEPSPEHQAYLPPDDQLLCYDYLYYMAVEQVRSLVSKSVRFA